MSKLEMILMLVRKARAFRKDREHYARNSHMHEIKEAPSQQAVDAVLVGFINGIAAEQGMDLGLYVQDLEKES